MSVSAQLAGRKAENSEWLDVAVRIGLVAYGVVHLMVAFLAVQLALGDGGRSASQKGALAEIASQPFGKVLVWGIAIGMVLLVIWRVLDAAFGHQEKSGADRLKARGAAAFKAVIYAVLAFTALKVAIGSQSKGGSGSETITAKVFSWPAGQLIVIAIGFGILGYGVFMAWRGWTEKFKEHLDAEGKSGETGKAYILFGRIGYISKGVAVALVGGLFLYAGFTHDPKKSGGLDQALHTVLQQPFGQGLLVLIGLGIGCYGLFCFARARHLSR